MRLSENFRLDEFLQSQTAERMGRTLVATPEIERNLRRLVVEVLQPMRTMLGRAISITSGYRPRWLNEAIGGSRTSAHMSGRAADLRVDQMHNRAVVEWLQSRRDLFPAIDQVILEHSWTHIGVADHDARPRGQFLMKVGGRYVPFV